MKTMKWVTLAGLTSGFLFVGLGGCGTLELAAAGLGALVLLGGGTLGNLLGNAT